jgi:hypothetical protein
MLRKIVSLTALLTFVLTLITSLILYIAPQGRVAYWSDWTLLGLSKTDWGNLHVNLGTLFLIALGFHLYYNWKPITAYLSKARKVVLWTREFSIACVITLVVALGTYFSVPPFSSFLNLSERIKDVAAKTYGEPPYGHAELSSLATLAKRLDTTPERMLEALQKAGYPAKNASETLLVLSRRHGVSPHKLFNAMAPAMPAPGDGLPPNPPQGTGSLSLAEFCTRHGLDVAGIIKALGAKGIKAQPDMTLKQIGEANGAAPLDIYTSIREAAAQKSRP